MAKEEKKEEKKDDKKKADAVPLTPEQEAAKAKKKRLILFGGIGLLVVLGGGAGAFMFLKGGSKPVSQEPASDVAPAGDSNEEESAADGQVDQKTDEKATGEGDAKKEELDDAGKGEAKKGDTDAPSYKGDFGLIKEFKPFHLNLGNPLENRYIRLSIGVEYKGGAEQLLEIDRKEPQLRDAVVSIVSRKTREHLLSPDGKDQVRLEIKNKLNQYLEKKIDNIYITDILIE
jgi:flagellar FliL protein